jgi:signal transduction histidine kinase
VNEARDFDNVARVKLMELMVLLCLFDGGDWLDGLRAVLADYRVLTAKTPEQARKHHAAKPLNAIVLPDSPAARAWLGELRASSTGETEATRPLLVLAAAGLACSDADLTLPPTLEVWRAALPYAVNAHIANQVLRREKLALTEELAIQRAQAHHTQALTDEIALLKNTIVRNVSHELRTPLLQVKSAVALLAEDAQTSTLSEYALGATGRLEGVVKNITLLADSLNEQQTFSAVIVREMVDSALRNLRRSWEHRTNVERVQQQLDTPLPLVYGSKQGLSTVMQLLIDNALKFSDARKPVMISATKQAAAVRMCVTDQGIGIPKAQQPRIFESFYQGDGSSTRPYGGLGVGLAIVKLILERHQIEIHVESEAGQGSTFWFDVPLYETPH